MQNLLRSENSHTQTIPCISQNNTMNKPKIINLNHHPTLIKLLENRYEQTIHHPKCYAEGLDKGNEPTIQDWNRKEVI